MRSPQIMVNARGPGIVDGRQVRAMAFAPAREQLLDRIVHERGHTVPEHSRALVVGGGYSPIAASLRDRGYATTAVDPSAAATALAQADTHGVSFRTAPPDDLGIEPASFDLVYCADTLEVTDEPDAVLAALAAAARPGATLILDTVTDTLIAKLIYLIAFPRLPFTRIMPPGRYSAARLRNPRDLENAFRRVGIRVDTVVGFEPKSVGALVRAVLDRRSGRIGDEDLPGAAGFHLSADDHTPVVTYFAVATKNTNGSS